jgi:hypothetical protein
MYEMSDENVHLSRAGAAGADPCSAASSRGTAQDRLKGDLSPSLTRSVAVLPLRNRIIANRHQSFAYVEPA